MQGPHSWAVFVGREANEIKEARPFVLLRGEGLWDSCLLRLLGGADIRERKIWEAKICPFLFLCYYTYAGTTAIPMVADITYEPVTSTSLSPIYTWELSSQVPTWHLHMNITQEHHTWHVQRYTHHSSEITSAFALSLQENDIASHPVIPESFIHSLVDLKKYLFYSVPDNVCLLSI